MFIPKKQNGMVLIVALVILVAMTLGGLGLMRSMETSSMIAGNIASQQTTIYSSDLGVESAIEWLESNLNTPALDQNNAPMGYAASAAALAGNQTGPAIWTTLSTAGVCTLPRSGEICSTTLPTDAAGNTVQYTIQRLCNAPGPINGAGCGAAQGGNLNADGENQAAGEDTLGIANNSAYYRITVRVTGPRNSIGFVQAIVNL